MSDGTWKLTDTVEIKMREVPHDSVYRNGYMGLLVIKGETVARLTHKQSCDLYDAFKRLPANPEERIEM